MISGSSKARLGYICVRSMGLDNRDPRPGEIARVGGHRRQPVLNMFGKKIARAWILCRHWSRLEVYLSNHQNVFQSIRNWSKLHSSHCHRHHYPCRHYHQATCSCQLVHLLYATFEEYTRQNRSLWSLSSGSFKLVCVVTQSTHYYSLAYHWKHASPFAPLSNSKWNPTPKPL